MIDRMLLFGATGDLAGRFLLPALTRMMAAGRLPPDFRLVGSGQESWDDQEFRDHVATHLADYADDLTTEERDVMLSRIGYRRADFTDSATVRDAIEATLAGADVPDDDGVQPGDNSREQGPPMLAYLALPTSAFSAAVAALCEIGLPPGSRVALEKPFGEDLESAKALNGQLAKLTGVSGEQAIFRVDHVLAMATVQNLLSIRLANRVLEPLWNREHIEQVDICWDETLALEGRAGYYDRAGALKDVLQNHLLQILCLVAMEPPVSLGERDLRDRKLDVLRSIPQLTADQVRQRTRRARYTAGRSAETGESLPDYVEEEGVDPSRNTETFAEVTLEVNSWRWQGTRFRLRSGKALAARRKEITVRFRPVPPLPFGAAADQLTANELVIGIDGPYDVSLRLTGRVAGPPSHLAPFVMTKELSAPELPAYSRVLMDVLGGDSRLSIRGDEAEEAWRVMTPVLSGWAQDLVPMEEYPAGSEGPG